jgi:hypothetical protein
MISAIDYKDLVCFIVESERALNLSYQSLTAATITLNNMSISESKRAFVNTPLADAHAKIAEQIANPSGILLGAVASLQRHIIANSTLESFYAANSITVPASFARLSGMVGLIVPNAYISESC